VVRVYSWSELHAVVVVVEVDGRRVCGVGDSKRLIAPVSSMRYDTIRYDTVYLTCSKNLTCSQLSAPHGTSRKIKENKLKINREA